MRSKSYRPCHCGADCDFESLSANTPCYGTVDAVDEDDLSDGDWRWVHARRGHWHMMWSDEYEPEEQP